MRRKRYGLLALSALCVGSLTVGMGAGAWAIDLEDEMSSDSVSEKTQEEADGGSSADEIPLAESLEPEVEESTPAEIPEETSALEVSPLSTGEITVDSVAELVSEVSGATGDLRIILSDEFFTSTNPLSGVINLVVPSSGEVNIVIDGQGQTLSATTDINMIAISGGSIDSSLTITNLATDGGDIAAGVRVNTSIGSYVFENVTLQNHRTGTTGAAISVGNAGEDFSLTIRNSTINDNRLSGWPGYSGGALAVMLTRGAITIENSVFRNNVVPKESENTTAHTGGGGGAGQIRQIYPGAVVTIKDSFFESNTASDGAAAGAVSGDGGALSIFDVYPGAKVFMTGNTFNKNIAGDDAGAVLIQGNRGNESGNVTKESIVLENNTFAGNIAQGSENQGTNGVDHAGALEIYTAGSGSQFGFTTEATLNNNTFWNNKVEGSASQGGALGLSKGNLFLGVRAHLQGNLFVDNVAGGARYQNIGGTGSITNNGGNLVVDNGSSVTYPTSEEIFGTVTPILSGITNPVTAGYPSETVPVLVLSPDSAAQEQVASGALTTDQRGFSRPAANYSAGSTQTTWVEFDVNAPTGTSATFDLPEPTLDGVTFYIGTTPTNYWVAATPENSQLEVIAPDQMGASVSGWTFSGWEDSEGTLFQPGDVIPVDAAQTLNAKWEADADPGTVEITGNLIARDEVTANTLDWPENTTFTYQWYFSNQADGANARLIQGATGSKMTIGAGETQGWLQVKVAATVPGSSTPIDVESSWVGKTDFIKTRIGGIDRYETAEKISDKYKGTGNTMFIATGQVFADSLSAAPAAAKLDASLVLTYSKALSPYTRQAIIDQQPSEIVIIGGTQAISANVEKTIKSLGVANSVTRVSGSDRYETSRLILTKYFSDQSSTAVYLATGLEYADALVASPAAVHQNGGVLLVRGTGKSDLSSALAAMNKVKTNKVIVTGGKDAISNDVFTAVKKTFSDTTRVGGSDRYETAIEINKVFPATTELLWIATGLEFADSLSAAAPAGITDSPIYLARKTCVPGSTASAISSKRYAERILVGGKEALNSSIEKMVTCKP